MRRALGAFVVAASLGARSAHAPSEAHMPGPGPIRRSDDPVAVNARCEGCHSEIAGEWRSSLHAASFTEPDFARALARELSPFCRSCHAPEADPVSPEKTRAALGVGCVTCHVVDRAPLAAPTATPASASSAHPVARTPAFATAAACAGCHEFDFPDAERRTAPTRMQSTITEHATGPLAGVACASCHMPRVDGHASHRFAASRDEAFVRSAVEVEARRTPTGVSLTLQASEGLGHAFPTGDLFRRLAVHAEADGIVPQVVHLSRRFAQVEEKPGMPVRIESGDTRVTHGAPTEVRFSLVGAKTIRWRVVYERVAFPKANHGEDAEIDGAIVVAAGAL